MLRRYLNTCCNPLLLFWRSLYLHAATHCNTLQHAATHCNTLQHVVTHFSYSEDLFIFTLLHSKSSPHLHTHTHTHTHCIVLTLEKTCHSHSATHTRTHTRKHTHTHTPTHTLTHVHTHTQIFPLHWHNLAVRTEWGAQVEFLKSPLLSYAHAVNADFWEILIPLH